MTESAKAKVLGGYELVMRLGFPVLLGLAGWVGSAMIDHEGRLKVIESTRYTHAQAQEDREGLTEVLTSIRVTLAVLDNRLAGMEKDLKGR